MPQLDSFIANAYAAGSVRDEQGAAATLAPHSIERAEGEALRDLAIAEGASRTIEVGLALGMSALFLCQAVGEKGRHVAIDPFQEESWARAGLVTLRDAGVEERVEVIEEESQFALPDLARQGREFDFAFIDGDHRFEGALFDLVFMARLVKPGGVIAIDDMWMPSVRLAVSYVEKNLDLELEPGALRGAFSWKRRPRLRSSVPDGDGNLAVLRTPVEPPPRPWDRFDLFF